MTPQEAATFFLEKVLNAFPESSLYEDYKEWPDDPFTDEEYDEAYRALMEWAETGAPANTVTGEEKSAAYANLHALLEAVGTVVWSLHEAIDLNSDWRDNTEPSWRSQGRLALQQIEEITERMRHAAQ